MDGRLMHPQTYREMKYLLTMLEEKGENETFSYIKKKSGLIEKLRRKLPNMKEE